MTNHDLTDREARIIAAHWQDGRYQGLASLQSTGAIHDSVFTELETDLHSLEGTDGDREALYALVAYCVSSGPRAAVPGWNAATSWTSAQERALESRFGITDNG